MHPQRDGQFYVCGAAMAGDKDRVMILASAIPSCFKQAVSQTVAL